jgi:septal ring factor EnvC (AmiA/AmiB activator)
MAFLGIGKKNPEKIRQSIRALEQDVRQLTQLRNNKELTTDYLRKELEKQPSNQDIHARLREAEDEVTRIDTQINKINKQIVKLQKQLGALER